MGSTSGTVQVQSGDTHSNTTILGDNGGSLHSPTDLQLKEQFSCGEDFAPKVRKPYTITKQRERWTDEEHKKFLEALKLYGRAWQKIEEHVGSKTAVQIRSHAQKFFSKVIRETTGGNTPSLEPIEIPPPRPKRKPAHPYPRKLGHSLNKETSTPEQPIIPSSPSSSVSEQENRSPTSVLSADGSEALGSPDSNAPNDSGPPNPVTPDERPQVDLELFPKDCVFSKQDAVEEASTRCLKLFGRTVLVAEPHIPSSATTSCKPFPLEVNQEKHVQKSVNFIPEATESSDDKFDCSLRSSPQTRKSLTFMQVDSGNYNRAETGSAAALPWWDFYGGNVYPDDDKGGDNEIQKRGSANGDKRMGKESGSRFGSSDRSAFSKPKGMCAKGFVAYKRCLSDRDAESSSTISSEDREGQRVRLCL